MLKHATINDVDEIANLLVQMGQERGEFGVDENLFKETVCQSFAEGVHWFLFEQNGKRVGTCHIQSVFNYWRKDKRFYLGGFYLVPELRGTGLFKKLYQELEAWVKQHGGVQIYCHIHEDNDKSLNSFGRMGMQGCEYKLMVHQFDEK